MRYRATRRPHGLSAQVRAARPACGVLTRNLCEIATGLFLVHCSVQHLEFLVHKYVSPRWYIWKSHRVLLPPLTPDGAEFWTSPSSVLSSASGLCSGWSVILFTSSHPDVAHGSLQESLSSVEGRNTVQDLFSTLTVTRSGLQSPVGRPPVPPAAVGPCHPRAARCRCSLVSPPPVFLRLPWAQAAPGSRGPPGVQQPLLLIHFHSADNFTPRRFPCAQPSQRNAETATAATKTRRCFVTLHLTFRDIRYVILG